MHLKLDTDQLLTRRLVATSAVLTSVLAVVVGCGSKNATMAPVKGKVLLNGKPLAVGSVGTIPAAGRGAHGQIQPDGTFELQTYRPGDGAIIGNHKVAIAAYDMSGGKGPDSEYGKLMIPKQYTNYETSGLTLEVKEGEANSPTIELKSP